MKPNPLPAAPPKAYSLRADAEEPNLAWRLTKHGVEIAYFRKRIGGKDTWERLGEIEPRRARTIIRERRRALGEDELLRRLGAVDVARDLSLVSELLAAYKVYFSGTQGETETMEKNEKSFLIIIRRGAAAGEASSLSCWSVDTIKDYESETVRAIKAKAATEKWSAEKLASKMASTQRTIAGTLRQARSIFCRDALASKAYRELVLPPDLAATMMVRAGENTVPDYVRPPSSVVQAVVDGIAALRVTDKAKHLAACLEILAGARCSSVEHARWDWLVDAGATDIHSGERVVSFWIRVVKSRKPVAVPVLLRDYEAMLEVRVGTGDYILPGKDEEERRAVINGLVPLLRGWGLDRKKPNYELRKLFGDSKSKAHGDTEAAAGLGHANLKMLPFYSERGARRAVSMLDITDPDRGTREKRELEVAMRAQLARADEKEKKAQG